MSRLQFERLRGEDGGGQSGRGWTRSWKRPLANSPDKVFERVASTYRLPVHAVLDRSHREAYQTAVYLLRRVANEPLQTVAIRF